MKYMDKIQTEDFWIQKGVVLTADPLRYATSPWVVNKKMGTQVWML